ncbi:MAG: trypsin-like peptidase domain-containing protein [Patescibacteria group bacterium]|nr:trypsin-like peptidase domain-containing protein [Patescibacteria group bacterium]
MPVPAKKKYNPIVISVVVPIVIATVFGFMAGFIAGQPGFTRTLMSVFAGDVSVMEDSSDLSGVLEIAGEALVPASEEERRVAVVERAMPAVVSVVVDKDVPVFEQYYQNPFGDDDFFGQFFNVPQYRQKGTERQQVGAGTGFIVSTDGLIVTNKHVVLDEDADYTVITSDGEKHEATVLGRDPANDLAVLKIEPSEGAELPFISLGLDEPRVGQSVIAIGYALGRFSNTVSTGIVSGLQRDITASDPSGAHMESLYDVIQTDAAINPGNSGGPLLNLEGEAIGISVAVEQGAQGIGFAIPIRDVKQVVDSVLATGHIARPFLGVRYVMITEAMAEQNQLPVGYGALIVRGETQMDLAVVPGSPADLAGIMENDIILELNGEKLTAENPLFLMVRDLTVGDTVTLKVLHKGEDVDVEATLIERQ